MNFYQVMDDFCGSQFWNSSLSWNTNNPDLTLCFEKTVLVAIPFIYLLFFAPVEMYNISKSKFKYIPWNWRNVVKLLAVGALCVLSISELIYNIMRIGISPAVNFFNPIIRFLGFVLIIIFVMFNRKYGIRSSGVQFFFWLLLALCGVFQQRTEIRNLKIKHVHAYPSYLFYSIHYSLVLLMLFLNCINDQPPRVVSKKSKNFSPEEESSFLSRLLFCWFETLAWKGYRKPLTITDLYDLKREDSAKSVVTKFENCKRKMYVKQKNNSMDSNGNETTKKISLIKIILKAFCGLLIYGIILKFTSDLLSFVIPEILSKLIESVKLGAFRWRGFFFAIILFSVGVMKSVLSCQYMHTINVLSLRIKTSLNSTIYKKALRISNKARKNYTTGEIVNLISTDAKNIAELPGNAITILSAGLQVILALYFLWNILGISVLAGVGVMIFLVPVNSLISNKLKVLQQKRMKNADLRVKLINEAINNLKILKLYAWEPHFKDEILKVRNKEVRYLKNSAYYNVGYSFIWSCAPFLVSLVCFATFVLIDPKNVLDAQVAFVSISLFNILKTPLNVLPVTISNIVQASVSFQRINKLTNAEELDPNNVTHTQNKHPLSIKNGYFSWGDKPVLKNIDISITEGSLTAIVGSVGSGKSTILSTFLGETHKIQGWVNTIGNIAYVPQQAWIQNATLRDNILFGKRFDRTKYRKVIKACALKTDFEMLPGGDLTEVGEKGINLSGGQRQRISLARAVYANADIYLLDDPLSAVDTTVGRHIFDEVIGPRGLLSSKTRVLVTHGITYLPRTDKVIVMKKGEISDSGTYQELLDKKGDFSDFLLSHISEESDASMSSKEDLISSTRCSFMDSMQCSSLSYDKFLLSSQNALLEETKLIESEKLETGSVDFKVYKYYLKTIGWFIIFVAFSCTLATHVLNLGCNFWLTIWSTDPNIVKNGTTNHSLTIFYLSIYTVFGIGKAIMTLIAVMAPQIGGCYAAINLHEVLLSRIIQAPMSFFDMTPIGRILCRFSKDIGVVDNKLPAYLYDGSNSFFVVLGTLFVTSYTSPVFIAVIIPLGLVYYLIQKFYVETSRQLKRLDAISRSPIYSYCGESITGAPSIRAFKAQLRFTEEFEQRVDSNNSCFYLSTVSNRWMSIRLEMLGNLTVLFVVIFAVTVKHLNAGLLGLSVTYALEITETLNYLVRITSEVENNIVSVERIREYSSAPQEAAWEIPENNPHKNWPKKGVVEFKDFSVRYRSNLEPVINNMNFKIEENEKIGIVGRSGAGKSSLTLSIFRILEADKGQILIDDVNIACLGLQVLRSRITIIPQEAVLFSGSLRLNLDPYGKYSDFEIWKTLENSHLKSFVLGLPGGLNFTVTEGGENFSLGQRQLICLGRALLRKSKVLILDEATAAVDLETDLLIQNTIKNEFKKCTVLTIAHRLNTIIDSNRVIVLDKGKIVEFDAPFKLLENKKGVFYSMCQDAGLVP